MNKTIFPMIAFGAALCLTSCKNDDVEFGDFEYQTVYFARQSPVRTITLGEDVYSTDLDNEHRFKVYARLGGVEKNKTARTINLAIDESLCDNLTFDDGTKVTPLPSNYYTMSGNTITIGEGQIANSVDVQLTDAFFADPLSTTVHYVLPLKMVSASDSILSGVAKSDVANPNIVDASDWDTAPMNYTLYGLKYKNKYHGCWLSKGTDVITTGGKDSTNVRMPDDWEEAGLVYLTTDGLQTSRYEVSFNLNTLDSNGKANVETKSCELILAFDDNGDCTVTTDTEGCAASGTGHWTYHGLSQAWGKKDRDELQLNYAVTFTYTSGNEVVTTTVKTDETLCMRDRQSKLEDFTYTVNK